MPPRPRFDRRAPVRELPNINDRISYPQLRVVDADGEQLGVIDREKALEVARERELDLVLVSEKADPPVCRIMDYGKFKFEQEIVFNPKSELSYLYLSKIFNRQDKQDLEEQNLNTVILLNPNNEEAIFHLAKLKLVTSDYKKSKELNKRLKLICKDFCIKSDNLNIEIENLSKK